VDRFNAECCARQWHDFSIDAQSQSPAGTHPLAQAVWSDEEIGSLESRVLAKTTSRTSFRLQLQVSKIPNLLKRFNNNIKSIHFGK
jgi:hypothetical protein